jgi:hypothetical protein
MAVVPAAKTFTTTGRDRGALMNRVAGDDALPVTM